MYINLSFRSVVNFVAFAVLAVFSIWAFAIIMPGIDRVMMVDSVWSPGNQRFHDYSHILLGVYLTILTYGWRTHWFARAIGIPVVRDEQKLLLVHPVHPTVN